MSERLGIVLAGGAARGAYEAGVLRFLFCDLPRRLGHTPWPGVVAGTSVGALNGTFVAARDVDGLRWLSRLWNELTIPRVYGVSYGNLFRTMRRAFAEEPFALADPEPLQRMILRRFPRTELRRAIDHEGVDWIVGATDLATGSQVLFVDSGPRPVTWTPRPGGKLVATRIGPRHTMASAALPLLFPPIEVGGRPLVDGGLRMNTPMRPVLRSGADRILVISLKRQAQDLERQPVAANLPFLVGKTLNALLLDPVEQDLHDARERNRLIRWGVEHFGPTFAEKLSAELGMREVETLFLSPSVDIGKLASEVYQDSPPEVSGAMRQVLRLAAGGTPGPEADLLSYLYFDRAYTAELERLGYEDAARQEEALVKLVAPSV